MKSFLLLSSLLISSQSFAYGHRFSTGTGISCDLTINAQPLVAHSCQSHMVSESRTGGDGININGQQYLTVMQSFDGAQCFGVSNHYTFETSLGDLSKNLTAELGNSTLDYSYVSPSAIYISTLGTIDSEVRNKVIYYIYKEADKKAEELDKALVAKLIGMNIHAITVTYNDQAKTLDAEIVTSKGTKQFSKVADFAKGVKLSSVNFVVPLETGDLNAPKRSYTAKLECNPVSERK